MDRNNQYKRLPLRLDGGARVARALQIEKRRKESRAQNVARHRPAIYEAEPEPAEETLEDRMSRLIKWRAERDLKKKMEAEKKQPAFKIGVPHHNFYSPKANDPPPPHCHRNPHKNQPVSSPKLSRVTRLRISARQAAKAAAVSATNNSQTSTISNLKPKLTKTPKRNQKAQKITKVVTPVASSAPIVAPIATKTLTSIAPQDYSFKGPTGLVPLPLFGNITIPPICDFKFDTADSKIDETFVKNSENQTENITENPNTPINKLTEKFRSASPVPARFSPFIVTSRGKSSARKELKEKMGLNNSSSEDIPTKETVMQTANISIEEEENTAQYYKFLLENEIKRLTGLCDEWKVVQEGPETSEDGVYMINQAIGQTNLLMRKKFERFRSLVADCETGKGEMLVTSRDLGGFWETLSMDIRNCDSRFAKLAECKANNWTENSEEIVMPVAKVPKKAVGKKSKPKAAVKSNFRAFITAARKKKTAEPITDEENIQVQIGNIPSTSGSTTIKTPQPRRKSKTRESSKDSPLILMKISKAAKTPEVKLDSSISYVNSSQTPGKGILKKSEELRASTLLKSSHKVNFDEKSLSESTKATGVEKKLEFSDDSCDDEDENKFAVPQLPVMVQKSGKSPEISSQIDEIEVVPVGNAEKKLKIDAENDIKFIAPSPRTKTPKKSLKRVTRNIVPPIAVIESTPDVRARREINEKTPEMSTKRGTQPSAPVITIIEPTPMIKTPDLHDDKTPEEATTDTSRSVPTISFTESTPFVKTPLNFDERTPEKSTRKVTRPAIPPISFTDSSPSIKATQKLDDKTPETSTRVLRSRSIVTSNTPKRTRRSAKDHSVINCDVEDSKENNLPDESENDIIKDFHKRRSARRSIKLDMEEDCTGCMGIKATIPGTPKRNRNKLNALDDVNEKVNSTIPSALANGDLISFESPSIPQRRTRRINK